MKIVTLILLFFFFAPPILTCSPIPDYGMYAGDRHVQWIDTIDNINSEIRHTEHQISVLRQESFSERLSNPNGIETQETIIKKIQGLIKQEAELEELKYSAQQGGATEFYKEQKERGAK